MVRNAAWWERKPARQVAQSNCAIDQSMEGTWATQHMALFPHFKQKQQLEHGRDGGAAGCCWLLAGCCCRLLPAGCCSRLGHHLL